MSTVPARTVPAPSPPPLHDSDGPRLRLALVAGNVVRHDGQGRVMLELARQLSGRGHDVTVYSHRLGDELRNHVRFRRAPRSPGPQLLDDVLMLLWATPVLRRDAPDATCIIGPTALPPAPYVYYGHFSHAGWRRTWSPRTRPSLRQVVYARALERLEAICVRRADRVAAVSPALAADLVGDGRPVLVVPNGVDAGEFSPADAAERELARGELGVPPDGFVLGFLGEYGTGRKGLRPLLEALELGPPDEHLLVAGHGPRAAVTAELRARGIAGRVHLLGFTDPRRLLAASDAAVVPSLYEPFSLVALEAAASGLPVVLSARAGAAPFLDGGAAVVDLPDDPRRIRDAIDALRSETGRLESMGLAAREAVSGLGWAAALRPMVELLEDLGARRREGAPG